MGDFDDDGAGDERGLDPAQGDPAVLLDLGQRGTQHVVDGEGWTRGGAGLSGEHEEAFGVAAHPGGQVVEFEEVGEGRGVGVLVLQLVDEADLAAHQVLVATAQAHQGVGGVAPQHGLLGGEFEGGPLHPVERVGHLPDFGPRLVGDGERSGRLRRRPGRPVLYGGHGLRQPAAGHLPCLPGEFDERRGHGPYAVEGQRGERGDRTEGEQQEQQQVALGRTLQLGGPVLDVGAEGDLDAPHPVDGGGHGVPPGHRRDGAGLQLPGAVHRLALVRQRAFGVRRGQGGVQTAFLYGGGRAREGVEGGEASGADLHERRL